MIFVGFMDGSKSIWYYNAKHWSIKVSWNIAFNENEEPREVEIMEVLGMQVEGEIIEILPQQPTIPQKPEEPQKPEPEPRQLWHTKFIDSTKAKNPYSHLPT